MPSFTATPHHSAKPRRVLHLVYPDVKLLDLCGPLQVLRDAAEYARGTGSYQSVLVSEHGGEVVTDTGITLNTRTLSSVRPTARDTVFVPGGNGVYDAAENPAIVDWLRTRGLRARILASTCTGAFLLAATGLLDGRRAVTHWRCCDRLRQRHPNVRVEDDPIYIRDGNLWTSAGVTSGIDLALAIVEDDLGRGVALELARNLVVYSKRRGGQSQFSQRLQSQIADTEDTFEKLHEWLARNLTADLRVERLAERSGMSPRTFHRVYTQRTGYTPARVVARARVEAARQLLEDSEVGVKAIAQRCGFGAEEKMRRTFQRELGVSPTDYRAAWSGSHPGSR